MKSIPGCGQQDRVLWYPLICDTATKAGLYDVQVTMIMRIQREEEHNTGNGG
jgi:hypothetical protein